MFLPFFRNNALYSLVDYQRRLVEPMRIVAEFYSNQAEIMFPETMFKRYLIANGELFERITRNYPKPQFNITHTKVHRQNYNVHEKIVDRKTFCTLYHFAKKNGPEQPKMLVVAPLSGHYATLLRGTVEGLLPHYDVYITDWTNAREVPVEKGAFTFGDFIDYVQDYIDLLGPELHVMAVCQPSVPVLAAIALMSARNSSSLPQSVVLMGGPIDTRQSPTSVNAYAAERDIEWFAKYVITRVPLHYKGAGRLVYPGFMQLFGFMAMNLRTHMDAHTDLFMHLVTGDGDSVLAHKKFYNEYLAVMDLPATFYLETLTHVFKEHALPKGILMHGDQQVQLAAIKKTALLCIEGERDDISGIGQTRAALDLCTNLPDRKKHYHLQKNVGHYGIFNGSRYRNEIVPIIKKFTDAQSAKK